MHLEAVVVNQLSANKILFCVIGFAALTFGAGASESETPQDIPKGALTLTTAVEFALNANPEVLRAREQINEFDQVVRQARSEALPKADATLSILTTREPGFDNSPFFSRILEGEQALPPEALLPFKFTNYIWRFNFSQPLYHFGRISNAMRAAKDELRGIRLDVQEVENRISRDVARACYGFLLARQRLEVLQSERAARERQLEHVQVRFELEDATRLDLLQAQVTLANLRPEILAAENDVHVAIAVINDALGREIDAPLDIDVPLVLPEPMPIVAEAQELLRLAAVNRPEFLRFTADQMVLEDRMGVTRANTLPEISANASFGINTFWLDNLSRLGFRSWSLGIGIKWKIFDGFRTSGEVGALRSQATQSRLDERSFRSELSLELERSTGTWRRALEAVEVGIIAVEQADEAQRVAEELFRYGAATTLDVLESARALRQAQFNLAQAAHEALVALAELKFLVGFRADAPNSVLEAGHRQSQPPAANGGLSWN